MPKYRTAIRRTQREEDEQRKLEQTDYRTLQAQAKELDIPANQSADDLRAAIKEAQSNG